MQSTNQPSKFLVPFAQNDSARVEVPATTTDATRFSQSLGSPPLTGLPPEAGGVPPQLEDFNGAMNQIARGVWWALGGGRFAYDAAWATDALIGGYARGAVLPAALGAGTVGMGEWYNNADNNTTDPDTTGTDWVPGYHYGMTALTGQTGGTVTLTPAQAAKTTITVAGALTSNLTLVVPAWVYRWTFVNTTTGAFTVSVRNPTSAAVTIPQDGSPTDVRGNGTTITRTTVTVPNASTTTAGIARLATTVETAAASDATIAVTPAGMAQTKAISWVAGLQTALDSKANASVSINAGAGLTGGGTLAGNVTLALGASGVTAGSYGGASSVGVFTVDGSGRIVGASSVPIAAAAGNITGTLAVANGGTGATTASGAVANLIGYTPVQQGGGAGQATNKLYLGWGDGGLRLQVDGSDQGPLAMLSGASFTGPVSSAGGFQVSSSRALKTDLRANPYGLDSVLSLETAVGRYREWFNADRRERVFLIAENVAEAVPPAVDAEGIEATPEGADDPQKFASYSPEQLLPVLVKAIQDLHAIVQAQGERIADLEENT